MRTTKVLPALLLLAVTLASPLPERVRFPDERSDDVREGRILLPPLEDVARDVGSIRSRANPIALFIPREPLPLAEPDQSLNAWQFYFPPGPPPPSDSNSADGQLDTAGSDLFPSATSPPPAANEFPTTLQETPSKDQGKQDLLPPTSTPATLKISGSTESLPESSTPAQNKQDIHSQKPKSIQQIPVPPANFQPQFEDGGWEPIAVNF